MVLHLVAALLSGLLVVLPPPPIINDGTERDIDIEEIGETVLNADPLDLVDALEGDFPDASLPSGFINPPQDEESILDEVLGGPLFDFSEDEAPGQVGYAGFSFDTDTDQIPGVFGGGGVGFVVLDHEVTRAEMRLLRAGAETGLEEDAGTIDDIVVDVAMEDVGGVESVSASVSTEDAGAYAVIHVYMMPVGNVLVVTWVMITDFDEVDEDDVQEYAHDLAVAAVLHLESVAEDVA